MLITTLSPLCRQLGALASRWQQIIMIARDPYRPERHYMRGPGPKWHAKNGLRPAA